MVSLSLLKLLEQNGFGTIDEDLFWEKMGLDEYGLYITDIGGSQDRGRRKVCTYNLYSRGKNDVQAYQKLQEVMEFLTRSFAICQLPAVPPITNYGYSNVTIMPPSTVTSVGEDINDRVIYSITGQIYYGEKVALSPPTTNGNYIETKSGQKVITEQDKTILMEK